jgi:hypothetical protein
MSLLEQQNLLARLYTDEPVRRAFLSDPAGTAAQFGLSNIEIEDIELMLPDEITGFAESLMRKRMREVEKMLPLTRKALKTDFEPCFMAYSEAARGSNEIRRLDDVLAFCAYLSREATGSIKETAEFERARIEFNLGRRSLVFKRFDGKYHILIKLGQKRIRRVF